MTKILAIKGHTTRGKEVIEIFELLGGKNYYNFNGNHDSSVYYIRNDSSYNNVIDYWEGNYPIDFMIFTLEQFLEKFPYKVGDKVNYIKYNDECPSVYTIQNMGWNGVTIEYLLESSGFSALTKDLQPYKEETFGECIEKTINECLFGGDEDTMVKEKYSPVTLLPLGSKVMIVPTNEDSEIIEENGKFYLVKKQQQYPKTYEECCEVLGYKLVGETVIGYDAKLITSFQRLKVCRDAYWKIYGEQMGLGKPWEPKWEIDNLKYSIIVVENEIRIGDNEEIHRLLVFPTEEMRDAFYENFKEIIEQCKELL